MVHVLFSGAGAACGPLCVIPPVFRFGYGCLRGASSVIGSLLGSQLTQSCSTHLRLLVRGTAPLSPTKRFILLALFSSAPGPSSCPKCLGLLPGGYRSPRLRLLISPFSTPSSLRSPHCVLHVLRVLCVSHILRVLRIFCVLRILRVLRIICALRILRVLRILRTLSVL